MNCCSRLLLDFLHTHSISHGSYGHGTTSGKPPQILFMGRLPFTDM